MERYFMVMVTFSIERGIATQQIEVITKNGGYVNRKEIQEHLIETQNAIPKSIIILNIIETKKEDFDTFTSLA